MAVSETPARVDFIPYDPLQDPLEGHVPYWKVRIEGIPPSIDYVALVPQQEDLSESGGSMTNECRASEAQKAEQSVFF
ncbi:hypothetical protein RRF57_008071 [Xylaria bambusicola]|uniref:Uncharacterized protein n=1 Tax=Xylaria bambusicola TaxID=326684 RepID=A0AAN7Z6R9_9PEZI